jgi:hypothetical protein
MRTPRRQRLGQANGWSLIAWLTGQTACSRPAISRPGDGWPAIRAATGMDAMAGLDWSLGRPYDLGAGKEHPACDSPATHSVLCASTA